MAENLIRHEWFVPATLTWEDAAPRVIDGILYLPWSPIEADVKAQLFVDRDIAAVHVRLKLEHKWFFYRIKGQYHDRISWSDLDFGTHQIIMNEILAEGRDLVLPSPLLGVEVPGLKRASTLALFVMPEEEFGEFEQGRIYYDPIAKYWGYMVSAPGEVPEALLRSNSARFLGDRSFVVGVAAFAGDFKLYDVREGVYFDPRELEENPDLCFDPLDLRVGWSFFSPGAVLARFRTHSTGSKVVPLEITDFTVKTESIALNPFPRYPVYRGWEGLCVPGIKI